MGTSSGVADTVHFFVVWDLDPQAHRDQSESQASNLRLQWITPQGLQITVCTALNKCQTVDRQTCGERSVPPAAATAAPCPFASPATENTELKSEVASTYTSRTSESGGERADVLTGNPRDTSAGILEQEQGLAWKWP